MVKGARKTDKTARGDLRRDKQSMARRTMTFHCNVCVAINVLLLSLNNDQ